MANKWVCVARVLSGALLCSGVLALGLPTTAHSQDPTESVQLEPAAAPSELQTSTSIPAETIQGASSDVAPANPADAPPPVDSAATPMPQGGGVLQRASDALNGNVRAIQPVPPANRDPRLDLLETSFPAEQPEVVDPEPALEPVGNPRRTQARTANGVTELSNLPEMPVEEPQPVLNRAVTPKPPLSRPQLNTELDTPRLESQVNLRTTSITRNASSSSPWLWVLAGTAALLLVPIAFLLTRPTR